jgi:hypothetical protein
MSRTLYEPPSKTRILGRWIKVLLVVLLLVGAGGYLYQRHPGLATRAAATVLGWFGREMITVEVTTSPTRAEVLLDGERMEELPLHVPKDDALHRVSAIAPGYAPAEVTFKADGPKQLFLTLRPAKQR